MRAEASGIVEFVAVKEGDRVTAGQELVRLDSKLAQSALDQAEANLRQAELQDAATKLDLDEEAFELRKRNLERSQTLYEQGLLPKDQLEQRELEFSRAARTMERAKRSIESSQARITQAQATVDQARTQLLHTTIRAPFDAFVLRRQVEVGSGVAGVSQSASGGTILMTLGDARESALYAQSDGRRRAAPARRPGRARAAGLGCHAAAARRRGVGVDRRRRGPRRRDSRHSRSCIALKSQPPGGWVNVPAQAEIVMSANDRFGRRAGAVRADRSRRAGRTSRCNRRVGNRLRGRRSRRRPEGQDSDPVRPRTRARPSSAGSQ